ncbi:uncharacterized protein LOC135394381 [Ornithodoros turicata]|uniref:uncharacterized protein LOC135394381 n=1 Tax=Ornithodoros turicata TaxID=34597 RepID=UPI003138A081
MTDRGRQFTSRLFADVCRFLGARHHFTTAYHPRANGLVERFHGTLKTALRAAEDPTHWVERFPLTLLGIRATSKADCGVAPSTLVFGSALRLPGQFFDAATLARTAHDPLHFATRLEEHVAEFRSPVPRHSSSRPISVHPDLSTATHVFLRHDAIRRPLQPPYDGPFLVHSRQDKALTLIFPVRLEVVSIDRVKPAFLDTSPAPTPRLLFPRPLPPQAALTAPRCVHWAPDSSQIHTFPASYPSGNLR